MNLKIICTVFPNEMKISEKSEKISNSISIFFMKNFIFQMKLGQNDIWFLFIVLSIPNEFFLFKN